MLIYPKWVRRLSTIIGVVASASTAPAQSSSSYFLSPVVSAGRAWQAYSAVQPDSKILYSGGSIRLNNDGSVDSSYKASFSGIAVQVNSAGQIFELAVTQQNGPPQLVEINADGSLDAILMKDATGINGFALQSDGKIIVWGSNPLQFGNLTRSGIARLNADGSLDTSFDPGFGPVGGGIYAVAAQSDGKILVGGSFSSFDKIAISGLVRLNPDGTVDSNFAPGAIGSAAYALAALSNGQILAIAGNAQQLVRLNSDGSKAWSVSANSISGSFNAFAVQPDGKILIGGGYNLAQNGVSVILSRINADGSTDSSFNPLPSLANMGVANVTSLAVDAKGHIYFNAGPSTAGSVRLNSDGSPDLSFNPGSVLAGQILASARSTDGRIFIAGTFVSINGTARSGLAALLPDGSLDAKFAPNTGIQWVQGNAGPSVALQPTAQLAVASDGSVLLTGSILSIGGVGSGRVVHFLPDGTLDVAFNPIFNTGGYVDAVAVLPSGQWVVAGSFSSINSTARGNVGGFSSSGSFDTTFAANSGTNGAVSILAVRPNGGLFIGGAFSLVGSNRNDSIAALNADGTVDATFDATGISTGTTIQSIAPLSDGRLMVVTGTSTANSLVRLLAGGATDVTYAYPSAVAGGYGVTATAVAVDANSRPIVALQERYPQSPARFPNIVYTYYLVRYDSAGNLDPQFVAHEQQANGSIDTILFGTNDLLVVGGGSFGNPSNYSIGQIIDATGPLTIFDGSGVNGLILIPNGSESVTVAPTITSPPQAQVAAPGSNASFSVSAAGVGLSYQWSFNKAPIVQGTGSTLSLSNVGVGNVGNYTVTISNSAGSVTSSTVTFSLTGPPVFLVQPSNASTNTGGVVVLSATPTGTAPFTYQWSFNGQAIAGATGQTLTLSNVGTTQSGTYAVTISNALGSATSTPVTVSVSTNTSATRISNISARAYVAPSLGGGDILIAGFVTTGLSTKQILIRGVGPALGPLGVSGFLADPQLTVFSGQSNFDSASSWDSGLSSTFSAVGAFGLPSGSKDAALLLTTVNPGAYTAQVTSTSNNDGVALVEVYDADPASIQSQFSENRLVNISARAYVGTGANILIGGFVVSGTDSETVLIRAVGPTLSALGVVGALSNPTLTVYDSASPAAVIASNTGWQNAVTAGPSAVAAGVQSASPATMTSVGAFALTAGSADSAMVLTLPPGAYTAQVSGASSSAGVALVEIYEVR